MCGFIGTNFNFERLPSALELIDYRGPDSSAVDEIILDNASRISLGHNRLSFLDLSDNASQPFSIDGASIVYNGEIYNYQTLRAELIEFGWKFRTTSDTEVIVIAYKHWGMDFVSKLDGMYAFAIIDEQKSKCFLVRDRYGVKPLYYFRSGKKLTFASEVQCIKYLVDLEISKDAVGQFLKYGYLLQPRTIYENVKQVVQGNVVEIDLSTNTETQSAYWSTEEEYKTAVARGRSKKLNIEKFDKLMRSAVSSRMIADVEIGVCLSGGYDSSICAKLASQAVNYQIDTFTIGFENKKKDESKYAREFANIVDAKNYLQICREEDSEKLISKILQKLGEPLADSSIIPTYQLFALVSEYKKAAISADGGDEMLAGYNKYTTLQFVRAFRFLIPVMTLLNKILGQNIRLHQQIEKMKKYHNCVSASDFMNKSREVFPDDEIKTLIGHVDRNLLNPEVGLIGSFLDQLQIHDNLYYQQSSILVKIDRLSMLHSVEAREPLLNYNLQRYAYSLSSKVKSTFGKKKIPLKTYSKYLFGTDILNRPKSGFGSPVQTWIKGILRKDVIRILAEKKISESLGLKHEYVEEIVRKFISDEVEYKKVWHLYVLYKWAEQHGI
jgi:asparagine synthase (glutamine-hydrolysing)